MDRVYESMSKDIDEIHKQIRVKHLICVGNSYQIPLREKLFRSDL